MANGTYRVKITARRVLDTPFENRLLDVLEAAVLDGEIEGFTCNTRNSRSWRWRRKKETTSG